MRRLLLVCALASGFAADAVAWDGDQLYKACEGGGTSIACLAYVAGIMDRNTSDAAQASNFLRIYAKRFPGIPETPRNYFKLMACRAQIPPGTTYGQAADIVARYLRDHPGERSADGSELVDRALGGAFPCSAP